MLRAEELGFKIDILKVDVPTTTTQQAADEVHCHVNQIAKLIIFSQTSNSPILFLTARCKRVSSKKVAVIACEPLSKADAALINAQTGFAIGRVSPTGHLNPIHCTIDTTLLPFETVRATAGTLQHLFSIACGLLVQATCRITADFCE